MEKSEEPNPKIRKWFDLTKVRGWIEAGGALIGVIAAAVGVYLQLFPSTSRSPSRPATATASSSVSGELSQSGAVNVVGTNNVVTVNLAGYTVVQHEKRLKQQEADLRAEFAGLANKSDDRAENIGKTLQAVQADLVDVKTSYQRRLVELKRAAVELEQLKSRIPQSEVERVIRSLETGDLKPANAAIETAVGKFTENEPNDQVLIPNVLPLNTQISGEISQNQDVDYFTFVTPDIYRDWIEIRLENSSSTLRPQMVLYDAEKASMGAEASATHGANIGKSIVSAPGQKYYLRVSSWEENTRGTYKLTVRPKKNYDRYEPNETVLLARPIILGKPIQAAIMDGRDVDYFRVDTGKASGTLVVSLENESSSLQPHISLYNSDKVFVKEKASATGGANINVSIPAGANTEFYIRVGSWEQNSFGVYSLSARVE